MSSNANVASALYEISELEAIRGDQFRSRAYQVAATGIAGLVEDVRKIRECGELESIPGVGKNIAAVITELIDTGESIKLEELRESLPEGVRELMELEGVGPKLAMRFYQELGITSIEALEKSIMLGQLRKLKGFGEKKEQNILLSIKDYRGRQTRFLLGAVTTVVDDMIKYMTGSTAVLKVEVAGSYRRRKETVGDLDLLVASNEPKTASERFIGMPPVVRVISHGGTRSTVVLEGGLQVDCRVMAPESYGAALQYFTGNIEHNVKLRSIGIKLGYKLNEYGLFERGSDKVVASEREEDIYKSLGMMWIPPELREDQGEIEAAIKNSLPDLVETSEVRSDLHVHSRWSEGTATIRDMAEKAKRLGHEFIAITDHSKSLGIAHGLDEKRLKEQGKEIDVLNEEMDGITILKGIECDIKADGSMDLPDSVLRDLDWVVASIHSGFKSEEETMTNRVISAMHNDYVSTVGHPTGRIIQKRKPYPINLDKIFEEAANMKVAMEINAYPDRLDLNDVNCKKAMEAGVRVSIGTDSHAVNQLEFINLGVSVARRGWLTQKDVLNTFTVKDFINLHR